MKNGEKGTLDEALQEMETTKMNYLKYDREILLNCLFKMFERMDLLSKFKIDKSNLLSFLLRISEHYNYAPFHNLTHIFNVTHMYYSIINTNRKDSYLANNCFDDIHKLSMLVACIGHDLDHPGVSNDFLMKESHQLSILSNKQSILENYHYYLLVKILK